MGLRCLMACHALGEHRSPVLARKTCRPLKVSAWCWGSGLFRKAAAGGPVQAVLTPRSHATLRDPTSLPQGQDTSTLQRRGRFITGGSHGRAASSAPPAPGAGTGPACCSMCITPYRGPEGEAGRGPGHLYVCCWEVWSERRTPASRPSGTQAGDTPAVPPQDGTAARDSKAATLLARGSRTAGRQQNPRAPGEPTAAS